MLNEKERKLVISFLEEYYEELGNNGCNDWEFPKDWTKKERIKFVKEYHEFNGDSDEFSDNEDTTLDLCAVGLLIHKLSKEFNNG